MRIYFFCFLILTLLLTACSPSKDLIDLRERQRVLEERVIALEAEKINASQQPVNQGGATPSNAEINRIKGNFSVLSDDVKKIREDLTYNVNQVEISSEQTAQLTDKNQLIEKRLSLVEIELDKLKSSGAAAVATDASAAVSGSDEETLYRSARKKYEEKDYEESKAMFLSYRQKFPDGKYIDDSYYFIGGGYYINGKNNEAANELLALISKYPDSKRLIDAKFLLAVSYERLKQNDKALEIYRDISADPAGSKYKLRADERISVIEGN